MSEPAPIRVGISSCLLGQAVGFDGGHKRDVFINRVLSEYFEFVALLNFEWIKRHAG